MLDQMIGKKTAAQLAVALKAITVSLLVIALALVVMAVTAVVEVL